MSRLGLRSRLSLFGLSDDCLSRLDQILDRTDKLVSPILVRMGSLGEFQGLWRFLSLGRLSELSRLSRLGRLGRRWHVLKSDQFLGLQKLFDCHVHEKLAGLFKPFQVKASAGIWFTGSSRSMELFVNVLLEFLQLGGLVSCHHDLKHLVFDKDWQKGYITLLVNCMFTGGCHAFEKVFHQFLRALRLFLRQSCSIGPLRVTRWLWGGGIKVGVFGNLLARHECASLSLSLN